MTLDELTNEEKSLLLFFETAEVDQRGLLNTKFMNTADMAIAKHWNETGFVGFGRISMADIQRLSNKFTHWCELSDEAITLALEERKARLFRQRTRRNWTKIGEL